MHNEELDGNGFIFNFFHYLWLKDQMNQCQVSCNIPDTIMYKLGEPQLWYFSTTQGKIQRKGRENLCKEKILQNFLEKVPECGIVGYFVWLKKNNNSTMEFEYFDEQTFQDFINKKDVNRDGYLQRFIQPRGDNNWIIKAIWGQQLCLFEQIINMNTLNDKRYDIYQRVTTFESIRSLSKSVKLKGKLLPQKIEVLCNSIQKHIQNVTNFRKSIIQMNLIFKINQKGQICLLFCQEIKTAISNNDKSESQPYSIPQSINQNKMSMSGAGNLILNLNCFQCEKYLDEQSSVIIDMAMVINAWRLNHISDLSNSQEQQNSRMGATIQMSQAKPGLTADLSSIDGTPKNKLKNSNSAPMLFKVQKNYQIPSIIRKLFPKLKAEEFEEYMSQPILTTKQVKVCEDCYLKILDSSDFKQSLTTYTKHIKTHNSVEKNYNPFKKNQIFYKYFKDKVQPSQLQTPPNQQYYQTSTTQFKQIQKNTLFQLISQPIMTRKQKQFINKQQINSPNPICTQGETQSDDISNLSTSNKKTDKYVDTSLSQGVNTSYYKHSFDDKLATFIKKKKINLPIINAKAQERYNFCLPKQKFLQTQTHSSLNYSQNSFLSQKK